MKIDDGCTQVYRTRLTSSVIKKIFAGILLRKSFLFLRNTEGAFFHILLLELLILFYLCKNSRFRLDGNGFLNYNIRWFI